jgi:hypothetical protein
MALRYWVGGGSSTNWNATGNTNWAATDGGAGNQSVPTTTDDVFFTASSPSPAVISAAITVRSVNFTGYTGTITHNASVTLTINTGSATSLLFSSGMTYTPAATTSLITFTHTSGTADITSNGKQLAGLTINGAGGTTRLLDDLSVDRAATNSTFTLTAGVFNANNFNVTATLFSSTNSNVRTITMGSGTWTLGAKATAGTSPWTTATTTNLTFNRNTANIVIASNGLVGNRTFASGSLTYNGLTIDSNSALGTITFSGSPIFASLAVGAGNSIINSSALTLQASPTWTGTPSMPIHLGSATPGSAVTITLTGGGTMTIEWGSIRDNTISGASAVGTNTINGGNTTGWSITPPSALTVASIVAGVWDEPTADNVTAGTFGAQLKTVLDAIDAKTTNLPSDPADASVIAARFDMLDASVTTVDGNVDAIKAKTDSLAFTVAGQVDANVKYVNDVQVTGVGSEADPWGP